jgi:predicted ATPase/DNA-binding SARP family transcriptional activator
LGESFLSTPQPRPSSATLVSSVVPVRPAMRLLGGLQLGAAADGATGDVRWLGGESRHHVQAVLALAGSTQHGVLRDEVVELLWPQSSVAAGRNRLYHTVYLARQALAAVASDAEWIVVRQSRVLLDERVWCDVHELERAGRTHLATLQDEALHATLALCQGDWMPGLDLGPTGQAIRSGVRQVQSALLREAVRRLRQQGDTPALRAHLDHLLRLEPTDEPAHRELMQIDLAAGRHHAVLRTFEKISGELAVQLGLKPAPQTRSLAEQASDALARPLADMMQGSPTQNLVGREPLIQSLTQQMRERAGVWNLTGLSGVGKSALARSVAKRLESVLTEGVVWVRLGDLAPHDCAASACVRALSLGSNDAGSDLQHLARVLQNRPMLLVLDDLDTVSDASALLAAIQGPLQARLIVTSRSALPVPGSTEVPVTALVTPNANDSLEQAQRCAGFVLFMMRCTVSGAEVHNPGWQRDAVRLLQRLDGLPLAIELAAARSASMTPGEIVKQLERSLNPLADGPHDLQARHRSMQSSLDWSVRLLSDASRLAYAAVAIFQGSFLRSDAATLAPAVGLTAAALDRGIDELLAAGLLSVTAECDEGQRLRMLHLPRAHARVLAATQGLRDALLAARLNAICTAFAQHRLDFEAPECAAGLTVVMSLEEDAVALLDHAQSHDPPRFVQLCTALCESWSQRNLAGVVQRWAPLAVNSAQALGDDRQHLLLHLLLTLAWRRAGLPIQAEQHSRALMALAARVDNKALVARAMLVRAMALGGVGEERAANVLIRQTLKTLQLQPHEEGYWTLAKQLPERFYGSSFASELDACRLRLKGSQLWPLFLGSACSHRSVHDDWAVLLELADEIVQIGHDTGWPSCLMGGLWHRAACLVGQDRLQLAMATYQEHLLLALKAGWGNGASIARNLLCMLHMRLGNLDSARTFLDGGPDWTVPEDFHASALRGPLSHATILVLEGRLAQATQCTQQLPVDWLLQAQDEDLIAWAELGALLAVQLGWQPAAQQLASDLRRLDGPDDHLPVIRRFRDHHFGPGLPLEDRDGEALESVRTRLRASVAALHVRLAGRASDSLKA